jgi:hypothetical protein
MRPDTSSRINVATMGMTYVSACQREAAEKLTIMRVRGVCLRGVNSLRYRKVD